MSDLVTPITTAVITAVPPTVVALAGLIQGRRNEKKAAEAKEVTDTLVKKTDEIHTLTNNNLSKVSEALNVANTKIEGMEKLVAALALRSNDK